MGHLRQPMNDMRHIRGAAARAGHSELDGQAVLLLVVHGLFAAANALSGTFVNVYLWKVRQDYALIGWFALFSHLAGALTFWMAGKWVKERNKMNSLRLGVALSAVFYLAVLLLGRRAADLVIPLGILQGMAAGFFWLAFNVVYFEITEPDNRDKFNGWSGLIGSLSSMIAPWISGLMITRVGDGAGSGYRMIFSLSLTVFLIGVIVSFFLKKRKPDGKYRWLYGFHSLKENGSPWRSVLPGLAAQGVREGVFAFIIGVLIFAATESEAKVGNYWLYSSAVGLVSYWLCGRWLKPARRSAAMLIAALMLTAAVLPFFIAVNYGTLILFGIIAGVFFPLYIIPMTSSVFDLIGKDDDSARHRVEYVVIRELALNAGRIAGTLIFIAVLSRTDSVTAMSLLLLGIGSSPILAWLFMRGVLKKGIRYTVDNRDR